MLRTQVKKERSMMMMIGKKKKIINENNKTSTAVFWKRSRIMEMIFVVMFLLQSTMITAAAGASSVEDDRIIVTAAAAAVPNLSVDYQSSPYHLPPLLPPQQLQPHPILQWVLWGEDLLSGLDEATKRSGLYSPLPIHSTIRGGQSVAVAAVSKEEDQEEDVVFMTAKGRNRFENYTDTILSSPASSTSYSSANETDGRGYTTKNDELWPSFLQEKRRCENETGATISTSAASSNNQTVHRHQHQLSNPTAFVKNNSQSSFEKYTFTLFQPNDGSQIDPDGIPIRYLKTYKGDRIKAKTALDATIQWRKEHNINTILARPYPKYNLCKAAFPMYFIGYDDTDHVVLVQKPGLIDLKLSEANGLTADDFLDYYVYINEYLWQILSPNANDTMTSIIDLDGLSFSTIFSQKQLIQVAISFCQTMESHYPARSHKTLLINVPRWFGSLYKIISPLLRESTKQKISILSKGSKEQQNELNQLLSHGGGSGDDSEAATGKSSSNSDDRSYYFSSSSSSSSPPSLMERDLQDFCLSRLKEAGVGMQSIIAV